MRIEIARGDITLERVDAIVNAANSSLFGGGGVDGAIHRAAGPALLAECREVRAAVCPDGLAVGQAVATGAGALPARWVIHTVGPNLHRGEADPAALASCFASSLRLAAQLGARSIAFPAISAGVFGWPAAEVARVAAQVMAEADRAATDPAVADPAVADAAAADDAATDPAVADPAVADPAVADAAAADDAAPRLPELVRFVLFGSQTEDAFRRAFAEPA